MLFKKPGHWENSVIRRSIIILSLSGPAMLFNVSLVYVATNLLSSQEFGIFYLAVTISNIGFALSVILSLFYSRHFVITTNQFNKETTLYVINEYIKKITIWSGLMSLCALAVLLYFGGLIGINAPRVIVLVVLIDFLAYVAESARAGLQGLHQFTRLGLYTLCWMGFRFILGVTAICIRRAVRRGLVGSHRFSILLFQIKETSILYS